MNRSSADTSNSSGSGAAPCPGAPFATENSLRNLKNDCGIFASASGVVRVSENTAPPHTSLPFAHIHDASSIGCCTRTLVSPRE